MKRILLLSALIGLMAFSCEKENEVDLSNTCNVTNPVEQLDWLKAEIESRNQNKSDVSKYFYISQATYDNKTVFIYNNCCPMCNTVVPVYDCQGELLFHLSDSPEKSKEIKKWRVVWQPADFACQLGN